MKERFSRISVAKILDDRLQKEKDQHQHRHEFVDGCLQCEKCGIIRSLIMDLGLCEEVPEMRMIDRRHFGHKAIERGLSREIVAIDDTDGRVSPRRFRQ